MKYPHCLAFSVAVWRTRGSVFAVHLRKCATQIGHNGEGMRWNGVRRRHSGVDMSTGLCQYQNKIRRSCCVPRRTIESSFRGALVLKEDSTQYCFRSYHWHAYEMHLHDIGRCDAFIFAISVYYFLRCYFIPRSSVVMVFVRCSSVYQLVVPSLDSDPQSFGRSTGRSLEL